MLNALLREVGDLFLVKDRDSVFVRCSASFGRIHGVPVEDAIGKTDFDFFPREDAERYRQEEAEVMATGNTIVAEHLLDTVWGKRWYEAKKTPWRDKDGNIVGLFSSERDITDRKNLEESLVRHRRGLEALYEISLRVTAQEQISDVLRTVARKAAELSSARMGAVFLLQPDRRTLQLVAGYGVERRSKEPCSSWDRASPVVSCSAAGCWLSRTTRPGRVASSSSPPVRSSGVLAVPNRTTDGVIGALKVGDRDQLGPFDTEDVRLLELFADQAGVAIDAARLDDEVRYELARAQAGRARPAANRKRSIPRWSKTCRNASCARTCAVSTRSSTITSASSNSAVRKKRSAKPVSISARASWLRNTIAMTAM